MYPSLRDTFERTRAQFPKFVISRQVLRVEEALSVNKSSYDFQLKQGNSSTDGPLENLLNDSDAFVMTHVAIGIKKQDATLSPPWYGNFQVYNYPPQATFVGAPAGAAVEWQALLTIWNGKLSFKTGSLERIKPTDTNEYLFAPAGADQVATVISSRRAFGDQNQGWVEQQATLLIDGSQNNVFTLNLGPGNVTAIDGSWTSGGAQTATSRNVLVLSVLGLLIANGAESSKRFFAAWGETAGAGTSL